MTTPIAPAPAQKLVMLYKMRGERVLPFVGYWNATAQTYLDVLKREQHPDVFNWKALPQHLESGGDASAVEWLPIEDAPQDGSTLILLFPSGRIDLGRWEHSQRIVNGEVRYEYRGWRCHSGAVALDPPPIPIYFAYLPALPVRGPDGYITSASSREDLRRG